MRTAGPDTTRPPEPFDAALERAADPALARRSLERLLTAAPDADLLRSALAEDEGLCARLLAVLGGSAALGEHLARHPEHWRELAGEQAGTTRPSAAGLRRSMLAAVDADPDDDQPVSALAVASEAGALDALRVAYRARLLTVAARDLDAGLQVDEAAAELADLAAATLEAALAVARARLPAGSVPCRLAVVAMGKCGGRELNYVSDVDVVFVAESLTGGADEQGALRTAARLAAGLSRACSATTGEGSIWPVDAALRPEGNAGPLVRTLASHRAYYARWAKTWEFQALLKARPVAGDIELGRAYVDTVSQFVWQAADRDNFVVDVQAMRRRVEDQIPRQEAGRQLKLGPGGLRDVEFAVQLLQLVHGRGDERLRSPSTIEALRALGAGGYVGREDAAALEDAYRFLRRLEHRIQLFRLRRTHVVPDDPAELRRLGRSLGLGGADELTQHWQRHGREVRRLHEKLFYRPLLAAVAALPAQETRLSREAARERLVALGYRDPDGALRHLEALTAGETRRASIQRTLLPVMLGWFADAPDADGGLLFFRQVSESLGSAHWYLRLLRDEGRTAERLATILATSRLAGDLLRREPGDVALLRDPSGPVDALGGSRARLMAAAKEAAAGAGGADLAGQAVRAVRRRAIVRTIAADLCDGADVEAVGAALSDAAVAALAGGLDAAQRAVAGRRRLDEVEALPTRVLVVAMGRLGGGEMGYASDADVLFVHQPVDGADEQDAAEAAQEVVGELRRLLGTPGAQPALDVDADLRPEGRQGPLVRTLASYAAYYERWSEPWECQALLRAQPVAGDEDLGRRFLELVDPLRWPADGLDARALRELRRIKARVEAERLPRGADPSLNTKLGPGGLADVEWTVQLLQLRYAAADEALRTTSTTAALEAARTAGIVADADAEALLTAWRTANRLRNAIVLVRGRSTDRVPTDVSEIGGVARVLGYSPAGTGALVEDYKRVTRRARRVVERVFFP